MHKANGWQLDHDQWVHRPWWKGIINDILRCLQYGNSYPWLICSHFNSHNTEPGTPAISYSFQRIHLRNTNESL